MSDQSYEMDFENLFELHSKTYEKTKHANFNDIINKERCHKCGDYDWIDEVEPLTWKCIHCGNFLYYTYGTFRQQIDIIMNSTRRTEYVYSEDKQTISPKKNEEAKKRKFKSKFKK